MQFFDHVQDLFRAGYPVIMLQTFEYARAYRTIKSYCKEEDVTLYRWNCVDGLLELGLTFGTELSVGDEVTSAEKVLLELLRRVDSRENEIYVVEGIYDFLWRAEVKVLLRKLATDLPKSEGKKNVVLLNPVYALPTELSRFVTVLRVPLPTREELGGVLDQVIHKVGTEPSQIVRDALLEAADGLTEREAELAFTYAHQQTEFAKGASDLVLEAKTWIMQPDEEDEK